MSRFFPQAVYEEDQKYGRTILTTHVLTRGFQAGSLVSLPVASTIYFLRRRHNPLICPSFEAILLRSTGRGAVIGTALLGVAVVLRMWGREGIEWQDRSWRLLGNKGQVECDDWTYGGMAVGAIAGVAKGGWRYGIGGMGVGSWVGMAGYMAWRYGVKGGKFEEREKSLV
ncbi:hypothetical protein LHYA1_G007537 [Lachnellula hyalina]|uniref:Uncharacterized protein n=1 Tax=Lachnellula hyalina TaxID=1316788 RepID=A0A8H8QVM5_9HELO|nr:uncharacterized protein LHYA1_G007537 [Lachnellula hyalina]TVY23579.1 hypothetical protein LHYA1_G007537 [Lachnellula hyalina]